MFSGCECFGIEKDSCGIYAVTLKALIIVAVFFSQGTQTSCALSLVSCVVWDKLFGDRFFKGLSACLRSSYGRSGRHRNVAINLFVF